MTLGQNQRSVLETLVVGLSHLADVIEAVPPEHQPAAFEAAERSYLKTMEQMGLSELERRNLTSSIMRRLRQRVAGTGVTEVDNVKKIYAEVADQNVNGNDEPREASPDLSGPQD